MIHLFIAGLMFLAPAEDVNLLQAVPPGAQIVVSATSIAKLEQSLRESTWARFLEESEMKSYIDTFSTMLGVAESEELKVFSPVKLYQSIGGGMTGFLLIEDKEHAGGAVMAAPGDKRDAFDEYLAAFKERLLEKEIFTESSDAYGDAEILILESRKEDSTEPFLFVAEGESVVAIVLHTKREAGLEMTQTIFDTLRGEGEDASILDVSAFRQAREQLEGPGDLEVYLDLEKVISLLPMEMVPAYVGMDAFTYIYKTVSVGRDEKIDGSAFIGIEGDGLIRDLVDQFMSGTSLDLLKFVPSEATGAQTMFMNIHGIYMRILEELQAQSEEEYNQFRNSYEEMVVNTLKIDPEKDIIARLDGRIATFTMEVPAEEFEAMNALGPEMGMLTQENLGNYGFMYLLGIKDSQAFQADFERMLRAFGVYVTLKKEDFQGQIIYSIQIPLGGMRLYWVFSEDVIGLSIFPTPVRAYLRLRAHGDQPTIEENEKFTEFIRNNRSVTALSMSRTADMIYGILSGMQTVLTAATSFTAFEAEDPVKPPSLTLPARDVIEKYFKGMIGYVMNVEEEGIYLKFVSE